MAVTAASLATGLEPGQTYVPSIPVDPAVEGMPYRTAQGQAAARPLIALVPQPRLIAALVVGAAFVILATAGPWWWALVALYHSVLAVLVVRDAVRLPDRSRLRATRMIPSPFSLGVRMPIGIQVSLLGGAGLECDVSDHVPEELKASPRMCSGRLDGEDDLRLEYTARPPTRGAFEFGALDVRYRRRGGWWTKQARVPLSQECAVYPDTVAVRQYQLSVRRRMPFITAMRRSRPPGAASTFASLRDYLPGDDIRRVNWKATARRDRPVTNELEAERGQHIMIAIDCGRLMTAPAGELTKLDQAINGALLLAWVAERHGDRVGLVTFTDRVGQLLPPGRGAAQMHLINQALYSIRPEYVEPDFGTAFARLSNRLGRRALVVVLTDVLDRSGSAELVSNALWLSHRHLVLVVAMSDPALIGFRERPVRRSKEAYEWAAVEDLLHQRQQSFEILRHGGVLGLDVKAGTLSSRLVERYLELKERALV